MAGVTAEKRHSGFGAFLSRAIRIRKGPENNLESVCTVSVVKDIAQSPRSEDGVGVFHRSFPVLIPREP
ncbi:hypothetical protein MATL_G00256130 [Megalops atlanticus]|uniref:Uncharacterized protein n=1 Tax=Megalops atlanticus TaxID=7932 RepID=A0A9D3PCI4_MEGAT|nr:hypothetical protein MATL_G00256130 [Megalops atlanticus]